MDKAGRNKDTEKTVQPNGCVFIVLLLMNFSCDFRQICFLSCSTLHSLELGSNFPWDLVLPHSGITNDDVGKPDEEERNDCLDVKIDTKECKGDDSEADGMKEEWEMTTNKVHVFLESFEVSELSDVDIEYVDLNCTSQDV